MDAPSRIPGLEKALLDAFGDYLAPTDSVREALLAAFEWAPIEIDDTIELQSQQSASQSQRSERAGKNIVVVDKNALIHGILAAGQHPSKRSSSANWLAEWLSQQGQFYVPDPSRQDFDRERNYSAFADGVPIIASRSLRGRVLPAAIELARQTIGRDRADMRHLLFALLQEPRETLGDFGRVLEPQKLAELKNWLVERIVAKPEKNEKVDAWRQIASGPGPAAATKAKAAAPHAAESVGILSDAPALVDTLGRQAFADVLAARIKQISESLWSGRLGRDSTFILHLDGPWGSGKTSILNFLKQNLESSKPGWLVVEFNAWQNQHRKPAWWPLVVHVGEAIRRNGSREARRAWALWNLKLRWLPVILTAAVLALAVVYFASGLGPNLETVAKGLNASITALIGLATLASLAWTASRTLSLGSKSAAESYIQLSAEPFRPIIDQFDRMVRKVGRPVVIFIDDMDRCDCDYVIEVLEGIQTLLRQAPVAYVVAGDHKWICSSFEKRYADFCPTIGVPGRPLGHLFLHKVFQLTIPIPKLSGIRQQRFWRALLEIGKGGDQAETPDLKQLERDAEEKLKGTVRYEDIQQQIDDAANPVELETLRAAAAKQITSPEATKAAEHRLQKFADLLEPNPRAMKLTVNAWGLNQACVFLEGRKVDADALGRWTIVQLRWPLLADYLAENWTDIEEGALRPAAYPDNIRALLTDIDVRKVFDGGPEEGRLNRASLKDILGATEEASRPQSAEPAAPVSA